MGATGCSYNIYDFSKDDLKMVIAFEIKGDANRSNFNQFYSPLLNLHYLYIVSKSELQVKMFKCVAKIKGRSLPIFTPHLSGL